MIQVEMPPKNGISDLWAMMFAGLPRKVNGHLENIHFLCASNKVPALKMAEPIVQQLLRLEERWMQV